MPITKDNALSILALFEDWQLVHTTQSEQVNQTCNINKDSSGDKVTPTLQHPSSDIRVLPWTN